jgi:exosortase E/protease (VPEID-CTERM system)
MAAGPVSWAIRGGILAGLLAAEFLAATITFDTRDLLGKPGPLTGAIERWAPGILQSGIVFAVAFAGLLALRRREETGLVLRSHAGAPVRYGFLAAHVSAFAMTFLLARQLFSKTSGFPSDLLGAACLASGLLQVALAALAFSPGRFWLNLAKTGGDNWWIAASAAALAELSVAWIQKLWAPATALTFTLVQWLLRLMPEPVIANPAAATIGTARFGVTISRQCSGLEGAGLFLVLGILGLILFRKDFRFPRAFGLIPLGIAILYLMNAVRIALLIWIGHLGAADVAIGGFHSQAGWIFFNAVSLGLFAWARRSSLFAAENAAIAGEVAGESDPAPYLLPFLTIVAGGMLVRAGSAGFEWLYGLKVVAAFAVLWNFRRSYVPPLDWRFGRTGVLAGAGVFALWIGLDFLSPAPERGMPRELAEAPAAARYGWILARLAGAVVSVPVAEELAFRGYLLRRFVSARFDNVDPSRFTWLGLAASSLLFGLLHGDRWIAGTLAGLIYACAMIRTRRIGDAVAGHALTNALLALWVLAFGNWRYW